MPRCENGPKIILMTNTNWSNEQSVIFSWFEGTHHSARGHLVVRARAGTGKTTTILEGVNRARERGAILLAAFNKSIATELQQRVRNPRVEAKTLHGLGFKFVMRNWNGVKVDDKGERALKLAADAAPDAPDPVRRLIRDLHTKAREVDPFVLGLLRKCEHVANPALTHACWPIPRAEGPRYCPHRMELALDVMMQMAVRFNVIPDEEWAEQGWDTAEVCEAALIAMETAKARTPVIDFADMIYLPLVHNWVRPWFEMVVVDEAQDMTTAQLEMAERACKRTGRICVVGDDRQAIYGFRGADSGSLDRLKAKLRAHEMPLTTTYRCPKKVVALAAKLVPDYVAAPNAPEGEVRNDSRDGMLEAAREGDFVLSRKNAPLAQVCLALLKRGRRARIKGRDIGKGVLAVIRKLKPTDVTDLFAKVKSWRDHECQRAVKTMTEEAAELRCGFITDQAELILELAADAATVAEVKGRMEELFSDDAERSAVMCSTVHKAKGLETERTWLLAGTFRSGHLEEENIKYVAITRAKQTMVWVDGFDTRKE